MLLTGEQIRSALRGAPETYEKDGLIVPARFSDEQRKGYTPETAQYIRTYCVGGAVLDFHTDSETLRLEYRNLWGENDWSTCYFEVWQDGKQGTVISLPVTQYPDEQFPKYGTRRLPDGSVEFRLKSGEKRVTLYLTHYWHVELASVALEDGASFAPHENRGRFLAFGDSITEGFSTYLPSGCYVTRLSRMLDYESINYGIGGEHCRPGVVTPGTYPPCDFVLAAYGTNDFPKLAKEIFEERLPAYMDNLKAAFPDTPVYVLLPIWRRIADEVRSSGTLRDVSARIRTEAEARGFRIIDCYDFLHRDPALLEDGLHPLNEGFRAYAVHVYEALKADGAFTD